VAPDSTRIPIISQTRQASTSHCGNTVACTLDSTELCERDQDSLFEASKPLNIYAVSVLIREPG
jgi:hypothetical protein